MAVPPPPADAQRLCCPACRRYIGTADGTYVECPPCPCGAQTTVRWPRRGAPVLAGRPLEVKRAH